eukprot:jgi/Bigna1/144186/aug1.85_g18894
MVFSWTWLRLGGGRGSGPPTPTMEVVVPAHIAFVSSSPLNETDKEKLSQQTDGHCDRKKGLVIEETGQSNGKAAQKKYLGSLVEIFGGLGDKRPRVLFLAACHSKVVGQLVVEKGQVDYAMVCDEHHELGDSGAPVFAKNFYKSLLSGKTRVSEAFESAKKVLEEMATARREAVIST